MNASRIALSALIVAGFLYAIHNHPVPAHFASKLYLCQYLTFIDLWIQLILHLGNILCSLQPNLIRTRDRFYALIAFPIGMFVSIAFWTLFLYDPAFMIAKEHPLNISAHLNHLLHTLPAVGLLIEALTTAHKYPQSFGTALKAIGTIAFIYISILIFVHIRFGSFPYPFLNMMKANHIVLFVAVSMIALFKLYLIGFAINLIASRLYGQTKTKQT